MKKILIVFYASITSILACAQQQSDSAKRHINIDEVEVKALKANAKLRDLPQKIEVIPFYELKTSAAKDIGEALKLNSSVDIIQYPGVLSSVGMRGFAPTTNNKYNALLINGVPAGTKNIASLGLTNIDQIEILKGPFSSLYGSNAMAGVINIVTPRHKDSVAGSATIGMGSFMTTHADVAVGGKIAGPLNFDFSASADNQGCDYVVGSNNILKMSETDEAIIDAGNTDGATFKNSKYSQMTGNLRLGVDVGKNWEVHLSQGVYSAKDVLSHGSFWAVYGDSKKDLLRYTERVELEGRVKNHTVNLTPYFSKDQSDNYNDNSDTAFVYYRSLLQVYGAQLSDKMALGKQTVVAGVDNSTQENASKLWSDADTRMSPYVPDYKSVTTGVFAQSNLHFLGNSLHVSAGARYDNIAFSILETDKLGNEAATEHYATVNPNVGLKILPARFVSIHGSWGTAFFAPDATQKAGEYTYLGTTYKGNADLDPETSRTLDAGVGYSRGEWGVNLDATWFTTKHKNLITSSKVNPDGIKNSGDEYTTYINAQEADMSGLEIEASYDLGVLFDYKFSLKAYVNATFMLTADLHINDTTTQDQKYVREQNANFGVEFASHKGIRFRANGRYIGSRVEDNWFAYYSSVRPGLAALASQSQAEYADLGLIKHPAFMVFDLSALYDVSKSITLGVTLANIMDENYTEKDGYNMPGRNVTGKCIINF